MTEWSTRLTEWSTRDSPKTCDYGCAWHGKKRAYIEHLRRAHPSVYKEIVDKQAAKRCGAAISLKVFDVEEETSIASVLKRRAELLRVLRPEGRRTVGQALYELEVASTHQFDLLNLVASSDYDSYLAWCESYYTGSPFSTTNLARIEEMMIKEDFDRDEKARLAYQAAIREMMTP